MIGGEYCSFVDTLDGRGASAETTPTVPTRQEAAAEPYTAGRVHFAVGLVHLECGDFIPLGLEKSEWRLSLVFCLSGRSLSAVCLSVANVLFHFMRSKGDVFGRGARVSCRDGMLLENVRIREFELLASSAAPGHPALSKLGMAPFLAPFSLGMGPFWEVRGDRTFRCGSQISSPFLGLSFPLFGV